MNNTNITYNNSIAITTYTNNTNNIANDTDITYNTVLVKMLVNELSHHILKNLASILAWAQQKLMAYLMELIEPVRDHCSVVVLVYRRIKPKVTSAIGKATYCRHQGDIRTPA